MIYADDSITHALEKVARKRSNEEKTKRYAQVGSLAGLVGIPFGGSIGAAIGAKEGRKLRSSGGAFLGDVAGTLGGGAAGLGAGVGLGALVAKALGRKRVDPATTAAVIAGLGGYAGAVGGGIYGSGEGAAWGHRGFKSKKKKGMKKRASVEVYSDDNVQYALEKLAKEDESGFSRIGKGSLMGATAFGGAGLAGGAYAGSAGRKAAMGVVEELAQEAFPKENVRNWSDKKMRKALSKEWKAGTLVDRLERAEGRTEKGLSRSARNAAMFRRFNPFKHVGRMPMYAALATGAVGAGLGAAAGTAGGAAYHGAARGHRRLTKKK